ncbi:MAG: hypothetical protein GY785_16000 [Gammaproteobacteria bacterium]|nr:hypothetical protein [Gammaproteobacteria bacterium]
MYDSAEVRWFSRGQLPGDMRLWFEAAGLATTEPRRTDDYLLLPGCVTTSVKLRDGRFEVKALTQSPCSVTYRHGITGLKDSWVKWSSARIDIDTSSQLVGRAKDPWISVSKIRRLRLVSLEGERPAEVSPDHRYLSGGCQVELTAIDAWSRTQNRSEAAPWWTLAFEAFGDEKAMQDGLDLVIDDFFKEPPPVNLSRKSSFSYPVWLQQLK